jgi:hypothetical protein
MPDGDARSYARKRTRQFQSRAGPRPLPWSRLTRRPQPRRLACAPAGQTARCGPPLPSCARMAPVLVLLAWSGATQRTRRRGVDALVPVVPANAIARGRCLPHHLLDNAFPRPLLGRLRLDLDAIPDLQLHGFTSDSLHAPGSSCASPDRFDRPPPAGSPPFPSRRRPAGLVVRSVEVPVAGICAADLAAV